MLGDELAPDPAVTARLALARLEDAGGKTSEAVEPLYLREADAKSNWTIRDLSQLGPT